MTTEHKNTDVSYDTSTEKIQEFVKICSATKWSDNMKKFITNVITGSKNDALYIVFNQMNEFLDLCKIGNLKQIQTLYTKICNNKSTELILSLYLGVAMSYASKYNCIDVVKWSYNTLTHMCNRCCELYTYVKIALDNADFYGHEDLYDWLYNFSFEHDTDGNDALCDDETHDHANKDECDYNIARCVMNINITNILFDLIIFHNVNIN